MECIIDKYEINYGESYEEFTPRSFKYEYPFWSYSKREKMLYHGCANFNGIRTITFYCENCGMPSWDFIERVINYIHEL